MVFFHAFRLLVILEDKNYKLKIPKNLLIYQSGKSPIDHAFPVGSSKDSGIRDSLSAEKEAYKS